MTTRDAPTLNKRPRRRTRRWLLIGSLLSLTALASAGWVYRETVKSWVGLRKEPAPSWSLIQSAIRAQQWPKVEPMLERWIEDHPEDGRARLLLANLLSGRGEVDRALQIVGAIADTDPVWPAARMFEAEAALRRFDAPRLEAICREVIAKAPDAPEPRTRLIYLFSLQQRPAEAREQLWQLYRISGDPRILVDLCLEATKNEVDVRGISPEIEQFLNRTPSDPFVRRAWGLSLLWAGRPAEAFPHLDAAARALSDDPLGRFALAEARLQLGERVSIPEDLGPEPTDSPPDAARWWLFRARLEEANQSQSDSLASLRRAAELDPNSYEIRFRLADALARAGDLDASAQREQAEALRQRADDLRKTFHGLRTQGFRAEIPLLLDLARKCLAAGFVRESRAWLNEALQLDSTSQQARERLESIQGLPETLPIALSRPRLRTGPAMESTAGPGPRANDRRPKIRFEDVAEASGLRYTYDHGARTDLYLADTMGGGVALIDYDQDGLLDVYFINGCVVPFDEANPPRPNRLFRNLGQLKFEDVTDRAGVHGQGYGMGAAVADYDDDGDDDLFVTGLDRTILYRNNGDGTFTDVTSEAGVFSALWTTAAGFADLDRDGDLDLYVATYVSGGADVKACKDHAGYPIHCSPGQYAAQPDLLFRNNGDGTFTDVSELSGIAGAPNGRGLGLALADLDADGLLDIYVANDASADFHFRNLGALRFEEIGAESGLAYDGAGHPTASMGVVADDLDGDGQIDLFHTNFLNEANTLATNLGSGQFMDATLAAGLAAPSLSKTGFGAAALDADLDGRLDLFVANGHVDDQPWVNSPMAQTPQFFRASTAGRFKLLDATAFAYLSRPVVGRGLAMGDLDNDGRVDLLVVHRGRPVSLLRNISDPARWISFLPRSEGNKGTPIGTQVTIEAGGRRQTRWLTSGTGYLSSHEQRIHFGLGTSPVVDRAEIRWPDGTSQVLGPLAANHFYRVWPGASLSEVQDENLNCCSEIDAIRQQ